MTKRRMTSSDNESRCSNTHDSPVSLTDSLLAHIFLFWIELWSPRDAARKKLLRLLFNEMFLSFVNATTIDNWRVTIQWISVDLIWDRRFLLIRDFLRNFVSSLSLSLSLFLQSKKRNGQSYFTCRTRGNANSFSGDIATLLETRVPAVVHRSNK